MSTSKFRASVIGFALLTLAAFAAAFFAFQRSEFPGPWLLWVGMTLPALVIGLNFTVMLEKPIDRG